MLQYELNRTKKTKKNKKNLFENTTLFWYYRMREYSRKALLSLRDQSSVKIQVKGINGWSGFKVGIEVSKPGQDSCR